jgi:hypothetical protein
MSYLKTEFAQAGATSSLPARGGWLASQTSLRSLRKLDCAAKPSASRVGTRCDVLPTRPLAEPAIGPRFARTRWLASTLPLAGRESAQVAFRRKPNVR